MYINTIMTPPSLDNINYLNGGGVCENLASRRSLYTIKADTSKMEVSAL